MMRLTVVLTLVTLMVLAAAADAVAQRQPYGGPRVDLSDPDGRFRAQRQWSGPPSAKFDDPRDRDGFYFTPTPWPFQGSYTRGWQRKLERHWGGLPADGRFRRFDDRWGHRYPSRGPIYTHPHPWPTNPCWGTRCQRTWPPIR